jgi:hypothetical protein
MPVAVTDVVGHAGHGDDVDAVRQRHEHGVGERHRELIRDDAPHSPPAMPNPYIEAGGTAAPFPVKVR